MKEPSEFSFGDTSVAAGYDTVLVPILFEPWTATLLNEFEPWADQRVLDLATGTGVVAQGLSKRIGPNGRVIAADLNVEMLSLARRRCAGAPTAVEFVESPAHPLAIPDESVDTVVCQQGFQFFPDRSAAALEMFRVLRAPGRAIVTTWRPVAECEYMGRICETLESIGEQELSAMLRIPFDFMPESELGRHFEAAGFDDVRVTQQRLELQMEGGIAQAVETTFSTPIGPKLRALTGESQREFRSTLTARLGKLSANGKTMGRMVSNVLSAKKTTGR